MIILSKQHITRIQLVTLLGTYSRVDLQQIKRPFLKRCGIRIGNKGMFRVRCDCHLEARIAFEVFKQ